MRRMLFDGITESKADEGISARPRRAAIVPVRLTDGERDQLAEVARDLGISLSTYVRQVVLSRPLPPRRSAGFGPPIRRKDGRLVWLPTRIPHDFRRTAVRNLERAGVPRSAAMAMVGHKTEAI